MELLQEHLARQSGVVSRRQLLDTGLAPHDIRRMLRRHELRVVLPGVYLDHTGRASWEQQAWAGVLARWSAALSHTSCLRAEGIGRAGAPTPIHLAVDRHRSPAAPPGVRLHRLAGLEQKVRWSQSPPKVRIEEAVIDVGAEAVDELGAVATLADAVSSRRTTAERLSATLSGRARVSRRAFLERVLGDVALGTCSVLEQGYLARVERPHGLPVGLRQAREGTSAVYRDVLYVDQAMLVELDGRLFHDNAMAFDRDLERDLDAAVAARGTLRPGWGQVFRRPCLTAAKVGRVLRARGWSGMPRPCTDCADAGVRYAGAAG
jgi:hypothetical protein